MRTVNITAVIPLEVGTFVKLIGLEHIVYVVTTEGLRQCDPSISKDSKVIPVYTLNIKTIKIQ